jgi:hypothetical protein
MPAAWGLFVADKQFSMSAWPTTQATIVEFDAGWHAEGGYANPSVRFEYTVANQKLESTGLNPSPFNYQSKEEVLDDTKGFAPGAVVTCWYNPADPTEAYLLDLGPTQGPLITASICGVLGIFVASAFVFRRFICCELHIENDSYAAVTAALASRRSVRGLSLDQCKLDSEVIQAINGCRHLRLLRIEGCELGDLQLSDIAVLPRLYELHIRGARVSRASLDRLGECTQLQALTLADSQFDERGLAFLGQLRRLVYLDLSGSNVSDDAVEAIYQSGPLEQLNLAGTQITDKVVSTILAKDSLKTVDLSSTSIGDESLHDLKMMMGGRLITLKLFNTRLSKASLKELEDSWFLATVEPPAEPPAK